MLEYDCYANEAEDIIRWGAARAGAIVLAPLLGSTALMANEVYMITKLAELQGVRASKGVIVGFLGAFGSALVGQTLCTIIPLPMIQMPVAIATTYALGKAAYAWLKAGQPTDFDGIKKVYDEALKDGYKLVKELKHSVNKDKPLGDEKKEF